MNKHNIGDRYTYIGTTWIVTEVGENRVTLKDTSDKYPLPDKFVEFSELGRYRQLESA